MTRDDIRVGVCSLSFVANCSWYNNLCCLLVVDVAISSTVCDEIVTYFARIQRRKHIGIGPHYGTRIITNTVN